MKRPVSLAVAALLLGAAPFAGAGVAGAMTLEEALAAAYVSSPALQVDRAGLRATNELVPQAKSGWRPTVAVRGSYGYSASETRVSSAASPIDQNLDPATVGATVTQPLFRGFRTVNGIDVAENTVLSARARLMESEQQVFLATAEAYSDVLRAQAEVELNANNEQVLRRQLSATQDRFQVGEITRTDVSLAESRQSGATAARITAEATLASARATFQRVVGVPPQNLSAPEALPPLPMSLDEAVSTAVQAQPLVVAAEFAARAALNQVDVVRGELLPTVAVEAGHTRGWRTQAEGSRAETSSITANLTVPLYQSGAVYSRLRQAKHTAGQRRLEVDQAQVAARERAIQAWETLVSARAEIESRNAQVRAASTALEGVQREAQVGARTVLDVLDAEQELLDANVNLVRAQRNERVAAFSLLSAVGGLTARDLGLPVVLHEPAEHYRDVRDQWFGTSAEAEADYQRR